MYTSKSLLNKLYPVPEEFEPELDKLVSEVFPSPNKPEACTELEGSLKNYFNSLSRKDEKKNYSPFSEIVNYILEWCPLQTVNSGYYHNITFEKYDRELEGTSGFDAKGKLKPEPGVKYSWDKDN